MGKEMKGLLFAVTAIVIMGIAVSGSGMFPYADRLLVIPSHESAGMETETYQLTQDRAGTPAVAAQYRQPDEPVDDTVDLTALSPYYDGDVAIERSGLTDTLGNQYKTGLRGYMSLSDASLYNANCYCIWDIGGNYRTLTATGIVLKKDSGSKREGSYKIYGDGRLLYSRDGIGSMTKPYQITIDITGVTDLKIEMNAGGSVGSSRIDSVLANVMLHR